MTSATAFPTTAEREPRPASVPVASSSEEARPAATQGFDRTTKLLAAITGVSALILMVFFLVMIALLGANGRAQRAYSADHPVPPVTRLAK